MKKKLPSFVSVIIIMASLFFALPITANAETDGIFTYTIENNEVTITGCDESVSGDVTIPSAISGYPVTTIGKYAFNSSASLINISIPASVTSIGAYAFNWCANLISITIPNSVKEIGSYMTEDSENFSTVYYMGSEAEWEEISMGRNLKLKEATIYFIEDPEHMHEFGEWVSDGPKKHKGECECGSLQKASHVWDDGVIIEEPTCTTSGITMYTCTVCGHTMTTGYSSGGSGGNVSGGGSSGGSGGASGTGHAWDDGVVIEEPTHTSYGVKIYTCTVCNITKMETLDRLATTISVGNVTAKAGEEITVPISISENVGIIGMVLSVSYDTDVLEVVALKKGEAFSDLNMTPAKDLGGGAFRVLWDADKAGGSAGGEILILRAKVKETASPGESTISIRETDAYDYDLNKIDIREENGIVDIVGYEPGDANDDGIVDVKDIIMMRQYVTGGYGITRLAKAVADLDKNGIIDVKDVIMLRKFVTGGYGVELQY